MANVESTSIKTKKIKIVDIDKRTSNVCYRNFEEFMFKHRISKDSLVQQEITNTRIGLKKQENDELPDNEKIYPGSYHIPDEEYNTFLQLYANEILSKNKPEYLTEKQLENDGPINIDMDFRYDSSKITKRQHDKDHIIDVLGIYLEKLKDIFQFDENSEFPIFVMEKPEVNILANEGITKDGIHIIIGIQMDRIGQLILRDWVIKEIPDVWGELPIKNTWDQVFDEGISAGHVNMQLYGSRKPKHDAYVLTNVFNVKYDSSDGELELQSIPLKSFDVKKNIDKLSVRYRHHLQVFMKNDFLSIYNQYKNVHLGGARNNTAAKINMIVTRGEVMYDFDISNMTAYLLAVKTENDFNKLKDSWIDYAETNDYELKEARAYALTLPDKYYEKGSYDKWFRLGCALKNTNTKLLIVWIEVSAKAKNFHYGTCIPDIIDKWNKIGKKDTGSLTIRSLMYWSKIDAPEKYEEVHSNSVDYFLELTLSGTSNSGSDKRMNTCGDWDIARVLYELCKGEFVCASIKNNIWYQFVQNRFVEIDSGTTLRHRISTQLRDLYNKKGFGLLNGMTSKGNSLPVEGAESSAENEASERKKLRSQRLLDICQRLSRTNDKKNIMTEAKELFYDSQFMNKLDSNPYLMCFKNGVVDFKNKLFRKGTPEDYLSICTNIDYVDADKDDIKYKPIKDEINDFMSKLFPKVKLREYMWEHMASILIGVNITQTFNMYIGEGRNGKSALITLLELVLGEYKGEVPLSLITGERGKLGGTSTEIVQLKGKRYAVMQEPQNRDRINEGKMKELTGGDTISARGLYQSKTVDFKPQFTLALFANVMMEIKSNDYGTWRRIRIVPFESLFTDNPVMGDKDKPYQFKIDRDIDKRFEEWKEVFMSMLVKIAYEKQGHVTDCDIVLAASNKYRESQDYISEFIRDNIVRDVNGKVQKTEINMQFSNWYQSTYGRGNVSPKDVHEYLDKQFGRCQNGKWFGIRIKYVDRDDLDIPEENQEIDEDDIDISDEA